MQKPKLRISCSVCGQHIIDSEMINNNMIDTWRSKGVKEVEISGSGPLPCCDSCHKMLSQDGTITKIAKTAHAHNQSAARVILPKAATGRRVIVSWKDD